jgi:hypothetical protein
MSVKEVHATYEVFGFKVIAIIGDLNTFLDTGGKLPPTVQERFIEELGNYAAITHSPVQGEEFSEIYIHVSSESNLGAMAHESVHAIHYMLSHIGGLPSFDNDEVEAHLIGHLMTVLTEACNTTPEEEKND